MRSTFIQNPADVEPVLRSTATNGSLTSSFCKKPSIFFIALFFYHSSFSQTDSTLSKNNIAVSNSQIHNLNAIPHDYLTKQQKTKRQIFIGAVNVLGYGGSLAILSNTWYRNYPKTSFHTFNDVGEWNQMDKFGHGWTAYNTGRISAGMWRWAGLSPTASTWIGGLSGTLYLTVIEILDGHSAQWGFSWGDMTANVIGSGIFISQQLLWKEQRIQYKFSFHYKDYGDSALNARADDIFGSAWYERMLKDYNAQTYWFSVNLKSFFRDSHLPAWLNISLGYGADGMLGGFKNIWVDNDTGQPVDRTDIPRIRQFYLAPDIDFTKIKTNKKWVRTVFFCLNAFKCPAPTLMIDSKGKFKAYALYF